MNIIPFKSHDFSIRAVEIDGNPWFVGKDIAEALGYSNYRDAMQRHCKGVVFHDTLQTDGGRQKMRLINEPDIFRLIVNSQLPAAEKFERWVFEEVLPSIRKTGSYKLKRSPVRDEFSRALKLLPLAMKVAQAIGCDKNAAAISANQAVRKETGKDVLALLDKTHLVAENQESLYFTPTELGLKCGGLSAFKVNKLLEAAGLQTKTAGYWQPTASGHAFARILDTGKRHSDGAPIQQIKWADCVVQQLPIAETSHQPLLTAALS